MGRRSLRADLEQRHYWLLQLDRHWCIRQGLQQCHAGRLDWWSREATCSPDCNIQQYLPDVLRLTTLWLSDQLNVGHDSCYWWKFFRYISLACPLVHCEFTLQHRMLQLTALACLVRLSSTTPHQSRICVLPVNPPHISLILFCLVLPLCFACLADASESNRR